MDAFQIELDLSKPYTIEFHGGPSDGLVVQSDADDPAEQQEAMMALVLTKSASVGGAFKGKAPGTSLGQFFRNMVSTPEGPKLNGEPPQAHKYRVASRDEQGHRIKVRFEYEGTSD
jgi:hypothetical protein